MGMAGYTKLFSSILASTIWREDDKTRIVWITLLAMSDKDGIADGSVPGLADFARVSVADCRAALNKLASPDPDSRSKEYEGRRIEIIDGGWRILNHAKYRAKLNEDERREYLRKKQAEHRTKAGNVNTVSTNVNKCQQMSTLSTHTDADADADAEKRNSASRGESDKKKNDSKNTPSVNAPFTPHLITESFSTPPVPPTPQFLDFPVDANRVPVDGVASKNQTLQPPPETTFKADFEKLWCEAYVAKFGAKYNYEGGRDGKAVKELEATKNSPATLIEIAKLAWDVPDGKNLYCQHSMTIHGFRRHINNIQAETAKHGGADAMTAPDVLMDKLNAIAKRPSGSRWTTAEVSALKPFRDITDEDLSKLKTYYHAKIADKSQDWRRQTLLAMLQNLPGELDKARRFKPATCF